MNEPRRLLDTEEDRPELDLLRAAAADAPPPDALQQVAPHLLLQHRRSRAPRKTRWPFVAVLVAAPAAASGVWGVHQAYRARATAEPSESAPLVTSPEPSDRTRILAERTAPDPAPTPEPAAPSEISPPEASAEKASADAQRPSKQRSGELPQPPAARGARAQQADESDSANSSGSRDLTAELALLGEVRRALAQGAGHEALRLLDTHARTFRPPALAPEAMFLKLEALRTTGAHAEARRLAESFLAQNPSSPLAPRVQAFLSKLSPKVGSP
jgi:hypothetical protein